MAQKLESPEAVQAYLADFYETVKVNNLRPETIAYELLKMVDLTPDSNHEINVALSNGREVFTAIEFLNMTISDFIDYDYGFSWADDTSRPI